MCVVLCTVCCVRCQSLTARMHHRQTIAYDTAFKHFFARHWTRATIGKRTRHHAQGVNGAFNAAVHKVRTQRGQYVHSFGKRTLFPHHVPQTEIAVRIGFFRQVGGIGKRGASKGVGVGVVPVLQRRTKRTRQTRHKEETHELETHESETTTATPFEQHPYPHKSRHTPITWSNRSSSLASGRTKLAHMMAPALMQGLCGIAGRIFIVVAWSRQACRTSGEVCSSKLCRNKCLCNWTSAS